MSIKDMPEFCEGDIRLHVPEEYRRGSLRGDERKNIESAVINLKRIAVLTERPDWSNMNVLDYGCGVKFSQALIQYDIDVKAYVGMDVFKGMIEYLNSSVTQPNFNYYNVPFRNEMYNRTGIDLAENAKLPGEIKSYDLITLQSVFTHFNPTDFLSLLHVLRRYAATDSRMLFTCFIDNKLEHEFVDLMPDKPLMMAYYKEHYIYEMLEKSNWKLVSLNRPGFKMQHQFVCEPY